VIDGTTQLLDTLARFAEATAVEVRAWDTTASTEADATAATRARLESIRRRYIPS
jgi:hypothetical protein